MNPYYREYGTLLSERFGGKVQKLSVDLALGCPNRDGTLGRGGCIYCNNAAFSPDADKAGRPVAEQIQRGKEFFARKYPEMKYLAYFQSYTGTYAAHSRLVKAYTEALSQDDVVGIIIGTRPDCLPDSLLDTLEALRVETGKEIMIEFGVESAHDITLRRINRGHSWQTTVDAIHRTAAKGFPIGVHLILGLPGENDEMMAATVRQISALPVEAVKFHQLQVLRGTPLHTMYERGELTDILSFTATEYASLCARILKELRPDIAVDRFVAQAPDQMLVSPRWGLKNYQFTALLHRLLAAQANTPT